jgi:2,3-bisphosphoglycerate-independent phosphoglycerate mutase
LINCLKYYIGASNELFKINTVKYIIILIDGAADHKIASLQGKSPLMAANTPNLDALCAKSNTGRLVTVPEDMTPGSEVANMGVLGYDVHEVYQGRGVLEAASMGIALADEEMALRCNLICLEAGKIKNHSAGHISSEEAAQIIDTLNDRLGSSKVRFHHGVSYRHLMVLKDASSDIYCAPPHDFPGHNSLELMPTATSSKGKETTEYLCNLILQSQQILKDHPVNLARIQSGKDPASSIWPWSPGFKPKMKTFKDLFGIQNGAVISAVDLIQGIGVYAGFKVIKVEGATGLFDTNYAGKAKATVDALKDNDFVFLHIEAPDEAGHEGDVKLKMRTIEDIDSKVVKYIVENTVNMGEPVSIAVLPDHPTPCELRTHVNEPVPFLIYRPGAEPDEVKTYDEWSVQNGRFGLLKNDEFIREFLQ